MSKVFNIDARYAFRSDTLENWVYNDPTLEKGEPGIATDKLTDGSGEWLKIGDGITPWKDLPWAKGPKGEQGIQGPMGPEGEKGEPGKDGGAAEADQTYNPESENAQSGVAVAQAVATKQDKLATVTRDGDYILLDLDESVEVHGSETLYCYKPVDFHEITKEGEPIIDRAEIDEKIETVYVAVEKMVNQAVSGTKNLIYTISDNQVTITDCDENISGSYVVPSSIDGYPVTTIKYGVFAGCANLTSVIIPDGVTTIEARSFSNCTSLKSLTIPESVISILSDVCYGCSNFTDVYFTGTEEQWNAISIAPQNKIFKSATVHYNQASATEGFVLDSIANKIGNIDTALENIITKYGLGGEKA